MEAIQKHHRHSILAGFVLGAAVALAPLPGWAVNYVVTSTFSADGRPHFPAVNAKGKRLYVSDVPAGTVTMFDTNGAKLAVTATGAQAHTVVYDESNNRVYVTNRGANTLSVLAGNTNAKIADIPVGTAPQGSTPA